MKKVRRREAKAGLLPLNREIHVKGRAETLPMYGVVTPRFGLSPKGLGKTEHCANRVLTDHLASRDTAGEFRTVAENQQREHYLHLV